MPGTSFSRHNSAVHQITGLNPAEFHLAMLNAVQSLSELERTVLHDFKMSKPVIDTCSKTGLTPAQVLDTRRRVFAIVRNALVE